MDINVDLVNQLFETVLYPLLAVLSAFLVNYVRAKITAIKIESSDATLSKYLDLLEDTIVDCVVATNQTYVDSLKAEGKFDAEAQTKAFEMTANAVLLILSEDSKVFLQASLGDLQTYINRKIEATVKYSK